MDKKRKLKAIFGMQKGAALAAGYSLREACDAGYSLSAALAAGYSLLAARAAGYSLSEALAAGYSLGAACAAGYSLSAARAAGYSLGEAEIKWWKSAPKIEKPYTTLLSDINNKKRNYRQSDWGDIKDFDPNRNICNSPMCIAGHLVNIMGKWGYELLVEKCNGSFYQAATIIHNELHPDFPAFIFTITDQDTGLAYIELMVEMENSENPLDLMKTE